jgi:hypothetical protein
VSPLSHHPEDLEKKALTRMLFTLSTLGELGESIVSAEAFEKIVKSALYMVLGVISSPRGAILRYRRSGPAFECVVAKGLGIDCQGSAGADIPLTPEQERFFETCDEVIGTAPLPSPLLDLAPLLGGVLEASLLIPLRVSGTLIGLLCIGEPLGGGEYDPHARKIARTMGHHLAVALHNHTLFEELKRVNRELADQVTENRRLYRNLEEIYSDTIRALGAAIDAKDPYTRGHSSRVARYSVAVAKAFAMTDEEIRAIEVASHLHDIGKISIDTTILRKPRNLDAAEREEIARHPETSYDILSKIRFPYPGVAQIARHHHERFDGNGYPDGKAGAELPLGVRIISLMDAYDAMTSDRPYRRGMSLDESLVEIRHCLRQQFDPEVALVFFESLRSELVTPGPHPVLSPESENALEPEAIVRFLDDVIAEIG